MLSRAGHLRSADGDLDIDDTKPWRVDGLVDVVLASIKPVPGALGMDASTAKRALRSIAHVAESAFRMAHNDPDVVRAKKIERRQHQAALSKAIEALSVLVEAGPYHICLPEDWRATDRDDYRNMRDDHVSACFFVESLEEKLEELKLMQAASTNRPQRRPFTYDSGIWSACLGMIGAMSMFRLEGLCDPKVELDIIEAAWMDAGLPQQHNAKNGETLRSWISKYLKRLKKDWK